MNILNENSSETPRSVSTRLSAASRISAWLTGSSIEQLTEVPDAERRKVRLAALSLMLISLVAGLGWWIALGIARSNYSAWHLPYAALAGLVVYAVDRAMLRAHWERRARLAARARGFEIPQRMAVLPFVMHWLLRFVVSLVISLTTASFLELEIFRQDTQAVISDRNLSQNKPIIQAATERIDAQIALKRSEIASLEESENQLVGRALGAQSDARIVFNAQIKTLVEERTVWQARIAALTHTIDCQTQNKLAEKYGSVRCDSQDGKAAVKGQGDQWQVAQDLERNAREERDTAVRRIRDIDAELAELRKPSDAATLPPSIQAKADHIAAERTAAITALKDLTSRRERKIQESVLQDPAHVPMSEGLTVRGEALEQLARQSPWLAGRIILVILSLAALDLAAIFVITVQPAPTALVVGELLASEMAIFRFMASAGQSIGTLKRMIMAVRAEVVAAEDELDKSISNRRWSMKTREAVNKNIDSEMNDRFARDI